VTTSADLAAFESTLRVALASLPDPVGLARVDARIAAAVASPGRRRPAQGLVNGGLRRLALVALGIVAIVTVAAGGQRLLERMAERSPGWERAWDRAEPLNLRQTVDGHTVILEGAYLDAGMLLLGLRTEDGSDPAEKVVRIGGAQSIGGLLTGRTRSGEKAQLWARYLHGVGPSERIDVEVSRIELPRRPLPSGAHARVKPKYVEGPWRFSFALRSAGGDDWTGSRSDRASGVTVTLDELTVSPTVVSGHLTFAGDLPRVNDDQWYALDVSVRHGDKRVGSRGGSTARPGYTFFGEGGFEDATGSVTIRIGELQADTRTGEERIKGPWLIEVELDGR
jgi:hypothetical protein